MEVPGDYVCRLKKAIYGLKTTPRRWAAKLNDDDVVLLRYTQLRVSGPAMVTKIQ